MCVVVFPYSVHPVFILSEIISDNVYYLRYSSVLDTCLMHVDPSVSFYSSVFLEIAFEFDVKPAI
jgi:hypothetical protein